MKLLIAIVVSLIVFGFSASPTFAQNNDYVLEDLTNLSNEPTATPSGSLSPTITPFVTPSVVSPTPCVTTSPSGTQETCVMLDPNVVGFQIPTLSDLLSFAIRAVFVFGGLAALFFLLLGAFAWITSGGDKEKVGGAQKKIQAAVVGVIMIVVVLAIVVTLEQIIFAGRICLGISCPLTIPALLKDPNTPPSTGAVQLIDKTITPTPTILPTTPSITVIPTGDDSTHPYNQ